MVALTLPRIFTPPLRDLGEPGATWGHDFAWFCEEILRDPLSDFQEWLGIHVLEVLTEDQAIAFAMLEDDPAKELEKVRRLYAPSKVKGGRPVPNGMLRFTYVLILISRQNGKTDFVKKLIKYFFFRRRVPEIMAAAQTLNKAIDLWNEILLEIELDPLLSRSLGRVDHSKGGQALWSKDRRRRYRPVGIDENAGRGDTNDLLYIDELRTQKTEVGVNSLEATTTVPDNGLIIATSNAGSDHSVVLRETRARALKPIQDGTWPETRIAIFEWSADPGRDIDDLDGWREANPDLNNGRITIATLKGFRQAKSEAAFRTEHLCQWVDELDEERQPLLDLAVWKRSFESTPEVADLESLSLAVDVGWSGEEVGIVMAAPLKNGKVFLSLNPLTEFELDETVETVKRAVRINDPFAVFIEPTGERSTLAYPLQAAGLELTTMTRANAAKASSMLRVMFREGRIVHDGSKRWEEALNASEWKEFSGGVERIVGSPVMVAASFAVWGLQQHAAEVSAPPPVRNLKRSHGAPAVVRRSSPAGEMSF